MLQLLAARARNGNVRAIELLLRRVADAPALVQTRDDPLAEVDELAARRRSALRGDD